MKKQIKTYFQGIVIGVAEIIPGVSGSTLALAMGIYDDFIGIIDSAVELVKSLVKFVTRKISKAELIGEFKKFPLLFAVFLVAGMGTSIVLLSHIINYLLENQRQFIFAFFFGLVLASIVIPIKLIKQPKPQQFIFGLITFVFFFWLFGAKPIVLTGEPDPVYLFIGGAVAICAMVLPSVSGSFVLLLLGLYNYVLGLVREVSRFQFNTTHLIQLVLFVAGISLGLSVFVKVLKFAFTRATNYVLVFLVAIMIASVRVLWPFLKLQNGEYTQVLPWEIPITELMLIAVLIVLALTGIIIIDKLSGTKELGKMKHN